MNFSNVARIFVLVGMLLSLSGCNGDNSSEDIKLIAELKIENQNLNEQIKSMQIQEEPIALEAQRIRSVGILIESVARQPEMADPLKAIVDPYLGKYEYYESEGAAVTDPLVLAGRVQVVGKFFESSLRQPEMKDLLSQMLIEYAGDNDLLLNSSHCLVNRARIDVSSALIENVARWGSDDLEFEDQIVDLIGNVQPEPNSKGCSLPESLVHIY